MNTTEELVEELVKLIDALDDQWIEETNCNYKLETQIEETRVFPAKDRIKVLLEQVIDERVNLLLKQHILDQREERREVSRKLGFARRGH